MMHTPVLLNECLQVLKDMSPSPRLGLDLTFGRGGHAKAFLKAFESLKITAVDQDQEAFEQAGEFFKEDLNQGRISFHHCNFHNWTDYAKGQGIAEDSYDYIMLDLGVSSPQLDTPERGFSFYHDGPLDMRMNQSQGTSAAEVVNTFSEEDLNEIFKTYGEVRSPYRVTRKILEERNSKEITSTLHLSALIESLVGWRKKGSHPATQYFMALRLYINNELGGLKESLPEIMKFLKPNGRILVISFHSLEDRIVKYIFKDSELGKPVNKKVIKPSRDEQIENKRSRSAHLRIFERHTAEGQRGEL